MERVPTPWDGNKGPVYTPCPGSSRPGVRERVVQQRRGGVSRVANCVGCGRSMSVRKNGTISRHKALPPSRRPARWRRVLLWLARRLETIGV